MVAEGPYPAGLEASPAVPRPGPGPGGPPRAAGWTTGRIVSFVTGAVPALAALACIVIPVRMAAVQGKAAAPGEAAPRGEDTETGS